MHQIQLSPATMKFLEELERNNHRVWFQDHKTAYQSALEEVVNLSDSVLERLRAADHIETVSGKSAMFRIYRDIRFSKDKTPYKTHWSAAYKRATKRLRGGYYFHLQPGGRSMAGGGFWKPVSADLQLIRSHIAQDDRPLRQVISSPVFLETFGKLRGEQLKTAPSGYRRDHPAIDLLRYRSFYVMKQISDDEVLSAGLDATIVNVFRAMRPFLDHMSEILTTDLNGESLVDD